MYRHFHSNTGLVRSVFTSFVIDNAYSTIYRVTSQYTLTPADCFPTHPFPSLTVGNLNIHYHVPNPASLLFYCGLNVSSQYFELAAYRLYILPNPSGVFTRVPFD